MNLVEMQEWFQKQSLRDQFALFLIGFVLIYAISHFFLIRPVIAKKNDFIKRTAAVQAAKTAAEQELEVLKVTIKNPFLVQMIAEQKHLDTNVKKASTELGKIKPKFMAPGDLARVTKAILDESRDVSITSILEEPADLWSKGDTNKVLSDYIAQGIYEQSIEVDFQSDFFEAITYLKKLEKLPWHIYWDSLNYKVLSYPKAEIKVKLHLLSLEKS